MKPVGSQAEIIDHNDSKHRCQLLILPRPTARLVMIGFPGSNGTGLAAGAGVTLLSTRMGSVASRVRTEL